jgi:hypothetical protein
MKLSPLLVLAIILFSCQKPSVNNVVTLRTTDVFGHPVSSPLLKAKDIYVNNQDTGYHFFYENDLLIKIIKGESNDTSKIYRFFYDAQQQLTYVSTKYNGFNADMAMEYDAMGRVNKMRFMSFYHEEYNISYPATNLVVITGGLRGNVVKDTLVFDNDCRLIAEKNYNIDTTYNITIVYQVNYTYSTLSHFLANSPVQDMMMLLSPVKQNYMPFEWQFVGGKNLIASSTAGYLNFSSGTTNLSGYNVSNNFPTFANYVRDNSGMAPWAASINITYY